MPKMIPRIIEKKTIDKISNKTSLIICPGLAPIACKIANSFFFWFSTNDKKTNAEAIAAALATIYCSVNSP